jgi:hypothetical protein
MVPKTGTVLPNARKTHRSSVTYAALIADALRRDLGETHRATKTVMRWTGAGERTVRNWFSGAKGPSGDNLLSLIRHSDVVLEAVLYRSGRERNVIHGRFQATRETLRELLAHYDFLIDEDAKKDRVHTEKEK